MLRTLTLIALSAGTIATAGAQSTEVIIRRQGQKDQVIHLDEKQGQEMAAKLSQQLQGALKELKDVELQHGGSTLRFKMDTAVLLEATRAMAGRTADIAVRNKMLAERAGEMARAQPAMLQRSVREAMSQPRIGVSIDNNGTQDTDKYGALVASVSPGGPADKAGIRSGDIITRVDGKSIASNSNKDESLPGVRLIEIVTRLPIGKPVAVDYRRGNANLSTKVTPVDESDLSLALLQPGTITNGRLTLRGDSMVAGTFMSRGGFSPRMPAQGMDRSMTVFEDAVPGVPGANFTYAFSTGGPLSSLELVSLNEKLGTYFGTSEGVLVVNVGAKDAFGLQPGDVIVSVDGRKVSASSQLMRIFRTYDKGEEFKIQVMRQKKAETLTGKLP